MLAKNKFPLSQPDLFHDACGIGFITEKSGLPSRRVVELSIKALIRMQHRGGVGADQFTGDGSGILTDIPQSYFRKILQTELNQKLNSRSQFGIGMIFTTRYESEIISNLFTNALENIDVELLGVRKVPVNMHVLGDAARESCPMILQYFFSGNKSKTRTFEEKLYLLGKTVEKSLYADRRKSFICSMSSKTIVYKGLMVASQLAHFYSDLSHKDYCAKVALFHERFSTNTISTWSMAQPFRMLAHNGEINTIKGNRLWMQTRESTFKSTKWNTDLEQIKPIIKLPGSDSFSIDNTLEFLRRNGRDLFHSIMMLIPEPYRKNPLMPKLLKDFYIYNENFIEPWDGPAALVFTDGDTVGAKLDRNGLRPLRYSITKDGLIVMASEAGVVDIEPEDLVRHRHMESGEILGVALDGSGIINNATVKNNVATSRNYSSLLQKNMVFLKKGKSKDEFKGMPLSQNSKIFNHRLLFGFNTEDVTRFLIPMANNGAEAIGSMGDDTPPAVMSKQSRRLYDFFKQSFAQVTNPAIDPYRERHVMSINKYLGCEDNLLTEKPTFQGAIRIESPILSYRDIQLLRDNESWFPWTEVKCHLHKSESLAKKLDVIKNQCVDAIQNGSKLIFLSDEDLKMDHIPMPMLLVISTVHQYLIEKKLRSKVSLICITGDVVEDHHVACLIGFGASAVFPYLAYDLIRESFTDEDWISKLNNYSDGLEKGLLKIMAKMGISTLSSYHGSMLFHGIGLSQKLLDTYFPSITCHTGGLSLKDIQTSLRDRYTAAQDSDENKLPEMGRFRFRKHGEMHSYSPTKFKTIQKLAKGEPVVKQKVDVPLHPRDLFAIKQSKNKSPMDQIEPVENILHRFGISAMSFGAISDETHRALARGAYLVRARSNTGEGGESSDRYNLNSHDQSENSTIKQLASGRFGVNTEYLVSAKELQIKIAQGAKPGEGGQLPGHKVTLEIANARSTTPGVSLISPPPHHDIYSIEDISQLIFDLNQVNPRAKVSVKLVSQPGIGLVASGVVKAGADIILISGYDGGTGATPLGSMKHTGLPWEQGLAEVHQTLVQNKLRNQVILRIDGGIKGSRDIIIGALLGAEEFDFGSAALISLGCIMARQCHQNTCPVGIATQDSELRKRFKGKDTHLANYLTAIAEDVQYQLSQMGFYKLNTIIGRNDLLSTRRKFKKYIDNLGLDLSKILLGKVGKELAVHSSMKMVPSSPYIKRHFDEAVFEEVRLAIMTQGHAVIKKPIQNTDRAVGTRLSGEIMFLHGPGGFKGNIQYRVFGAAGQSLGAFLVEGIEIRLRGIANDYVGKGMSGGLITIRSPKLVRQKKGRHSIIGNVSLYGATGGRLLVAGRAGERFAVRNSGAAAVVEGVGNHCCEYMTRGTVVVLGEIGRNFGAGMTGGVAYIYYSSKQNLVNLNKEYVKTESLSSSDLNLVWRMLRSHKFHTGSPLGDRILNEWESSSKNRFVKITPKAMDAVDVDQIYSQQISMRLSEMDAKKR